ncbi:hypothetical protein [Derxia lacustris]|uniref:hypothetical protein n=1 Tax=Derxia lacustris TaxID=764842 RepID=UPI00111C5EB6|nr:hypothetical protein [Derxia lacustris]
MLDIQPYFSVKHGKEFAKSLPNLRKELGCIPFAEHDSGYGVGGDTFRALRKLQVPPSKVYQDWAAITCKNINPRLLSKSLATGGFQDWHTMLAESLQQRWISRQNEPLSFAHQHKLIDLFVKWLSRHDFENKKLTKLLELHSNSALDSRVLSNLNACLSHALPLTKPSMGDIHCRETYDFCQKLIESFASYYGGTKLLFDYFSWKKIGND